MWSKSYPSGVLSIIAGDGKSNAGTSSALPTPGPATDATLDSPYGVAVDSGGNVYIADTNDSVVDKVTPGGTLSIFAGNGQNSGDNHVLPTLVQLLIQRLMTVFTG